MFENIKLMLDITDNKHDGKILLYLDKISTAVLDHCNVKELNRGLESFVEDKVISIMKPIVTGGTQNTGEIKSISRGDTKIDYNVGEAITTSSSTSSLTDTDKLALKPYTKARCY